MNPYSPSSSIQEVLNIACGRIGPTISSSRALYVAVGSLLFALVLSSLWGGAAGSHSAVMAASSGIKVPIIVLLSTLTALPATLLTLRLSGVPFATRRLFLSIASGVLAGSLMLAALAPIVGIYYHTSAEVGVPLAIASAFVALGVGAIIMVRNTLRQLPDGMTAKSVLIPLAVFAVVMLAAMLQFVALASPVLPSPSAFDGGIDGMLMP